MMTLVEYFTNLMEQEVHLKQTKQSIKSIESIESIQSQSIESSRPRSTF